MAVVVAFGTLNHTTHAGLTAYFRATGCTSLTIADVLPLLSKITVYEDEYVIGEMKIWDTGSESIEPNNCAMCRVMVYNDGWIVAWFDKESQNQEASGLCGFIDAQTLDNVGSVTTEYPNKYNGCQLKVTSSSPTDPECPDNTVFCIRNVDSDLNQVQVHANYDEDYYNIHYHFNTGHTYAIEIYQDNGNLVWWGHNSNTHTPLPSNMSNRLYRAIYEMWESLRINSNTPDDGYTSIDAALLQDGIVFTDDTIDFNDSGAPDVPLLPTYEQINDAFYYGMSVKSFSGLKLNIGQAGIGSAITWEYWDGLAWSSLSVTDNTVGFTVLGTNTVVFTPPVDWAKTDVNGSEMFWIRSRCTLGSFTTTPYLTQGWVYTTASVDYEDTDLGMYSFEDTSANYCLLCGVNEYAGGIQTDDVYFYNTSLPGKTIYKHSISCGSAAHWAAALIYFYVNDKCFLMTHGNGLVETNGYIIFNIKTIAGTAAIQNVFRCYGQSTSSSHYSYGNMASVLITG